MEGCGTKVSGEVSGYGGASTPGYGGGPGGAHTSNTNKPDYDALDSQMDEGIKNVSGGALGGSAVEELVESGSTSGGGGRKKKKKHKSGEECGGSAKSSTVMAEDELVDAVMPMLPENEDVEDLMFPSTLPPGGGETLVGGQYLLNNSLLDQILTEKKMQILQSPEVMEFLRKQLAKK